MANTKSKKTNQSSEKSKATDAKTDKATEAEEVEAITAEETNEQEVEDIEEVEVEEDVDEDDEYDDDDDEDEEEDEEDDDESDDDDDEDEEEDEEDDDESDDEEDITPVKASSNPFAGFFARKCDKNENILTIFKTPRIWGALLGEIIGTMLLTTILLTLGVYQPLYIMFGILAITLGVYALSGAHLNPLVTAGMMATRRVSAIRGVLYIVAQIIGAWFALLLVNAFRASGGDSAAELPVITELTSETIWSCIFIELVGAIIIGFFFTRAQSYRTPRGTFAYAAVVAGGLMTAILFGIVVSGNYLGLQNSFIMNPAIAIMYQIFPSSAADFGELMGKIALAGSTYIIVPMLGGIIGSFISDIASKLSCEETCCDKCPCKK